MIDKNGAQSVKEIAASPRMKFVIRFPDEKNAKKSLFQIVGTSTRKWQCYDVGIFLSTIPL
ncbi:hypothetical protein AB6869_17620 [Rahnella rivi]|uniref:hypothetical protein n=1 Tax=Rahnella rivi TaxID=2816249 RepID=UPI0039BECE99